MPPTAGHFRKASWRCRLFQMTAICCVSWRRMPTTCLAERRKAAGLRSLVEDHLLRALPSGKVQAATVAEQLGMSARSFTRYLAREGTSFSQILDRVRSSLALRYLEDRRVSLQQIAWLLGYSELAAFNHAFRRWFAMSPRASEKSAELTGIRLIGSAARSAPMRYVAVRPALAGEIKFLAGIIKQGTSERPMSPACDRAQPTSPSGSSRGWSRKSTLGAPGSPSRQAEPQRSSI